MPRVTWLGDGLGVGSQVRKTRRGQPTPPPAFLVEAGSSWLLELVLEFPPWLSGAPGGLAPGPATQFAPPVFKKQHSGDGRAANRAWAPRACPGGSWWAGQRLLSAPAPCPPPPTPEGCVCRALSGGADLVSECFQAVSGLSGFLSPSATLGVLVLVPLCGPQWRLLPSAGP